MTLGIGVLCNHGETIVLGSEQRASYSVAAGNVSIDPNDEAGKQFYLKPYKVFVSVAGSLSICHSVYSQFAHLVYHLRDREHIPPELLMALLQEARWHQLRRIYDWQLKRKMGVSLHEWGTGKAAPQSKNASSNRKVRYGNY